MGNTADSQSWGPWFKSQPSSSVLRQGTLSSLRIVPQKGLKALVAVVAKWIRPQTFIPGIPGPNPSPPVMSLGNALYPHCLVPWKGLKAIGPQVV